jgi:hypothetical protein
MLELVNFFVLVWQGFLLVDMLVKGGELVSCIVKGGKNYVVSSSNQGSYTCCLALLVEMSTCGHDCFRFKFELVATQLTHQTSQY